VADPLAAAAAAAVAVAVVEPAAVPAAAAATATATATDPSVTGLPSHSALVAPPLRLPALRWRGALVVLVGSRPPPGVSTACLVALMRFSGAPFPGEPPTALCPLKLEGWRHNAVDGTPAGARLHVLSGPRDSRSLRSTRKGAPVGVQSLRMCRCPSELARAHSQGGPPRGARDGEACIGGQEGRRDDRRRPLAIEWDSRFWSPKGGELERRRSRTRQQAGASEEPVPRSVLVRGRWPWPVSGGRGHPEARATPPMSSRPSSRNRAGPLRQEPVPALEKRSSTVGRRSTTPGTLRSAGPWPSWWA
jgi:hypothetical protein